MNTEASEVWKDIPGYEGKYQASTEGRVRSLDFEVPCRNSFTRRINGRILRPGPVASGHMYVMLHRKTNGIPVHQLIMRTFVGDPPPGNEVRHLNGNPKDNRLANLCYGTRSENIKDVLLIGKRWRILNLSDVDAIRARLASGERGVSIARAYDVSQSTVSSIKRGNTFSWY